MLNFIYRVGRAITPPNALMGPAANSSMPTAAAVAAAAATAKIQAMDAVASNAVLGLENIVKSREIETKNAIEKTNISPTLSPIQNQIQPEHTPVPQLSPGLSIAQTLQPPQVVTAVLGSQGTITVTSEPVTLSPILTTAKPIIRPPSPPPVLTAAEVLQKAHDKQQEELQKKLLEDVEPQTLQQQESMSIKGQSARHLVMQRLMRRPLDSKVVILRNMVGPEDVDDLLKEEIQDECSKFGVVERVIIYNEKQTDNEEDDSADVIVKIFVEFSLPSETEKAKDALNGRYFGGRLVRAELYDQALFDHGDLSG